MKITNDSTRKADAALVALGFERMGATGSGHHRYHHPTENWNYTLAASPSDWRWLHNFWSDMARLTGEAKPDLIARLTGERKPGSSTRERKAKGPRPVRNFDPPTAPPSDAPAVLGALVDRLGVGDLSLADQIEAVACARQDAHRDGQREAAEEMGDELDRLYALKRQAAA